MSNIVKVAVALALREAAPGTVFGGLRVSLSDTSGPDPATVTVTATDIQPGPEGTALVEVQFENVAVGPFSVVADAVDGSGLVIEGFTVSGSGDMPPPPPPPTVLSPVAIQLDIVPA